MATITSAYAAVEGNSLDVHIYWSATGLVSSDYLVVEVYDNITAKWWAKTQYLDITNTEAMLLMDYYKSYTGRVVAYSSNGTLIASKTFTFVTYEEYVRPFTFYWISKDRNILVGDYVDEVLTTENWTRFTDSINGLIGYYFGPGYERTFTYVYTGRTISAAIINEAMNNIDFMGHPLPLPPRIMMDDDITAYIFNQMQDVLNSIYG